MDELITTYRPTLASAPDLLAQVELLRRERDRVTGAYHDALAERDELRESQSEYQRRLEGMTKERDQWRAETHNRRVEVESLRAASTQAANWLSRSVREDDCEQAADLRAALQPRVES